MLSFDSQGPVVYFLQFMSNQNNGVSIVERVWVLGEPG